MTAQIEDDAVKVPLKEYLALIEENSKLKDNNPWMKWVHFAHMIDSFRFFPRVFFGVYIFILGLSSLWFMGLAAPVAAQVGYISTVVGAGAAWFGLYVNSGWKHGKQ